MLDKLNALWEIGLGSVLMTMSFWGPVLDKFMMGAHFVATVGGAAVAVHGVIRIIRRSRP